ncbi:MAG TPA: CpsB/CapC family capsule biosynthesis tyrosine phosphatase [Gemmatimonadaceae bacterium]
MIDIHTHLLPGVDDGSPNADHSAMVIARLFGEGVRGIVCTPHLNASRAGEAPFEHHAELLASLRGRAPAGLTLHAGFEIMLDTGAFDVSDARLGLAGSRARLVEFPRRGLPPDATEQLLRVRSQGLVPVVAHPERYHGCTTETIATWRELGAVIQCDAMGLLGGGPMTEFGRAMLGAGQVDIIASDNHGDRRSLATVLLWMSEIGADAQAGILMRENPALLLAGGSLRPVSPVSFQRGMFDRLRELIFRPSRRAPVEGPSQ